MVSGTVSLFKTDWYRFDAAVPGQTLNITVFTDPSNNALTLFDLDLNFVAREMGAMSWPATSNSRFLLKGPISVYLEIFFS